jgi:hypothetical protein
MRVQLRYTQAQQGTPLVADNTILAKDDDDPWLIFSCASRKGVMARVLDAIATSLRGF